jgi:hypothetical protein
MSSLDNLVAASAGGAVFFQDSDSVSIFREAGGGGNPANSGANHKGSRFIGHLFISPLITG